MSLASCLWPYRSWRLARCDSTVSALILSKKFRQMGVFPRNTNTKMAEFPSTTTLNATEVETCQQCYPSLLFCFVFVPTGSNWELDTYKSNVEMWTLCQWLLLFFCSFHIDVAALYRLAASSTTSLHWRTTNRRRLFWPMVRVEQPCITSWTESCLRLLICSVLF